MKISSILLAMTMSGTLQSELPTETTKSLSVEVNQANTEKNVDLKPHLEDWLDRNAKDPDSVKLKLITPARHKLVVLKRGLLGKKKWSGWIACYRINAKNSYGAYTGYRPVAVMKTDDSRLMVWVDNQGNDNHYRSYERQIVENYC